MTNEDDGRIASAIKEKEYLETLRDNLLKEHPTFNIVMPPPRYW